jgi:hypothetical protein
MIPTLPKDIWTVISEKAPRCISQLAATCKLTKNAISPRVIEYNHFIHHFLYEDYNPTSDYVARKKELCSFFSSCHCEGDISGYLRFATTIDPVLYLRERGVIIDCYFNDGNTPIHYALMKGNYSLVKILIELGADINIKDKEGNTPLLAYLLRYVLLRKDELPKMEIIELLLNAGADPNATDYFCETPLILYNYLI